MKKSLLVLPLMTLAFSMTGCSLLSKLLPGGNSSNSSNSSQQSSSGSSQSGSQSGSSSQSGGGGTGESISLTASSLLGYSGENVAYETAYENTTVSGVGFTYQQIGAYGAGMQFRNKLSDSTNGTKSNLNNTSATSSAIKSISFKWNDSRQIFENTNVLKITFASSSSFSGGEVKMLNTEADVKQYTVSPSGSNFTFVKIEIDDDFTYTCYWDSININL